MAITRIGNPAIADQRGVNFRNIIINGDMRIAQRGTSVSGVTANAYTSTDRFFTELNTAGTWTSAQDTDVPSGQGFVNSMKWSCTTANASLSSNSYFSINQKIEGQNLYYLKFGTSSAESLTASFWVKSNKTGTYIYYIYSHQVRIICKTFTIDSTDTWEKKTITFDGDTISAITSTNAFGITSGFVLVAGSDRTSGTQNNAWTAYTASELAPSQTVNLADSTSNYINITGVQLEAGEVASDFEFLPVDVNIQRCRRYFEKSSNIDSALIVTSQGIVGIRDGTASTVVRYYNIQYSVEKRATPTLTTYDMLGATGKVRKDSTNGITATIFSSGSTCFNLYPSGTASHYGIFFGWYSEAEL